MAHLICFVVMIFVNSLDFKFFTDFKDDPDIYVFPDLKYVGIELWQVKFFFFFSSAFCSSLANIFNTDNQGT